jgi:prevent-host-death family protein
MKTVTHIGVAEARAHFAKLLSAIEHGRSYVITRRGKPIAALVPVVARKRCEPQQSLLPLVGSGRGLWGNDSSATIAKLRDEFER